MLECSLPDLYERGRFTAEIETAISFCMCNCSLNSSYFRLGGLSSGVSPIEDKAERISIRGFVTVEVFRQIDGSMTRIYHQDSSNVITNYGLQLLQRWLSGTTTGTFQWTVAQGGNDKYYTVSAPNRIALSNNAILGTVPVNATHTSWANFDASYPSDIEITTGGLARIAATSFTYNSVYTPGTGGTKGTATFAMAATFTCAAGFTFSNLNRTGLFSGAYSATNNGGTAAKALSGLIAENSFANVSLQAGDIIAITWRITI